MCTAFLFLAAVDYSFDAHILNQLTPLTCSTGNPLVQTIANYYQWRMGGQPFLRFFDLFVVCMLPIIFLTLIKANIDAVRGVRASLGRHLIDAECVIQLVSIITITVTKARPTAERVVAMVRASDADDKVASAELYGEITALANYHFLILIINALQWFVPTLRWIFQRKQDAMRAREEAAAALLAARAAEKAEKALAKAIASTVPTEELMAARVEAAEAATQPKPAAELKKRK